MGPGYLVPLLCERACLVMTEVVVVVLVVLVVVVMVEEEEEEVVAVQFKSRVEENKKLN